MCFTSNIGQPDPALTLTAIDAIRNIDRKVLEYSPSAGYRSYREKLVGYYAKFNINLYSRRYNHYIGGSEAVLFPSFPARIREMKLSFRNLHTLTIWHLVISAGAKIRTIATTIEEGFSFRK